MMEKTCLHLNSSDQKRYVWVLFRINLDFHADDEN